jgi:hypothetical protein
MHVPWPGRKKGPRPLSHRLRFLTTKLARRGARPAAKELPGTARMPPPISSSVIRPRITTDRHRRGKS